MIRTPIDTDRYGVDDDAFANPRPVVSRHRSGSRVSDAAAMFGLVRADHLNFQRPRPAFRHSIVAHANIRRRFGI